MYNDSTNESVAKILERFDASSPEMLIRSLAAEFAKLYSAQAAIKARLAVMETLQGMADRILETGSEFDSGSGFTPTYPTQIRLEAEDSVFDVDGFHELEHGETAYRWTGPERHFSFHLFVDRRAPGAFVLKFGDIYASVSVDRLRAFVDGKEVMLVIEKAANSWEAQGVLPPRRDPGGTVLTFVVPQMSSPQSKGFEDGRLLGVSFQTLTVETSRALAAAVRNKSNKNLDEMDSARAEHNSAAPAAHAMKADASLASSPAPVPPTEPVPLTEAETAPTQTAAIALDMVRTDD